MIPPRPRSIIPGSAACESWTIASTFSRIARASSSTGSSANLPYVPIPALLTRSSTAGSADSSRASTSALPFFAVKSADRTSTLTPYSFSSCSASASRRDASRATTTTSSPRAARARANWAPIPDEAPVTSATGFGVLMSSPPTSEAELRRHRVGRRVDRVPHLDLVHRALGVLEAVTGERAHDGLVPVDQPTGGRLEEPGDGGRRRRLHETSFRRRQEAVRVDDLGVAHRPDLAARLVPRRDRALPVRRVADADRGGDRLGMRDGLAVHERRRPERLPSEHPRAPARAAVDVVLQIALPVGADVERVPDGDAVHVGRVAKGVDDLERRRLLPFDPKRVDRVHDRDPAAVGERADYAEGGIEVAVHRDDARSVDEIGRAHV